MAAPVQAPHTASRVILVATAHLRWPRTEASVTRHAEMLGDLLSPGLDGNGWFACLEPDERGHRDDDEHELPADDPWRWHAEGGAHVAPFLADLRRACLDGRDDALPAALHGFRHRVFVDARRLQAATGFRPRTSADDGLSAVLDMRLSRLKDVSICHVNLSVWSHVPWSAHHRPPGVPPPAKAVLQDLLARSVDEDFLEVRKHEADFFARRFTVANLRVFGRPYRAPLFWTVVSGNAARDPAEYLPPVGERFVLDAGRRLLEVSDVRDASVAASILDGDLLVLRRFGPDVDLAQDVPRYVVFPARAQADRPGPTSPGIERAVGRISRQEDGIRRTITTLTELESVAAAHLWDVEFNLEIWDNHLLAYSNAVDRAGRIWDALASHLPVERRGALARLYRSVELLHQTLIQGVSDVDRILTRVEAEVAAIDDEVADLRGRFARALTETRVAGHEKISDSLTSTGHFLTVARRAQQVSARASRVASNYRNLLTAIGDSFNERRVRENDALQKSGALLTAAVAIFGLIAAGGTSFDPRVHLVDAQRWILWGPVAVLSAVLVGAIAWWILGYARVGKLGGFRYRFVYRRLWRFLRMTSSSRLEHLEARMRRAAPEEPANLAELSTALDAAERGNAESWQAHDDDLAREFAHVFDLIDLLPGDERVPETRRAAMEGAPRGPLGWWRRRLALHRLIRADRIQLQRMVEKWSLRTLLFTERPREMWRFSMVALTLMYRAAFPMLGREGHVVSRTDLRFVLQRWPRQGFRTKQVAEISSWLDAEAEAVLWAYDRRTPPDHVHPSHRGRLRAAAHSLSFRWRLVWYNHRNPGTGRAARMLAVLDEVGLWTGVGGSVECTERRDDARDDVLDRIRSRSGPPVR